MEHLKCLSTAPHLRKAHLRETRIILCLRIQCSLALGINRINNCVKRFPFPIRFSPSVTLSPRRNRQSRSPRPPSSCRKQTEKNTPRDIPPQETAPKDKKKNNRLKTNSRTAKTNNRSTNVNLTSRRDIAPHHILIFSHTHIPPRLLPTENISPTDGPHFSTSIAAGSHSAHTPLLLHSPRKATPEITPAGDSEGHA